MTAKPPAHEAFLTMEEVEYLQVNLRTVYRLIKSKSIPAVRVGRQWRFKRQDIDDWLEGRKGASRQGPRQGPRRLLLALRRAPASYDLMISDLNMPGMDGLALIREVKRLRPELPIIITGYSTEKSARDAVNLRVAGYLTKPLRDSQVLEAAAGALGAPAA